MPRRTLLLRAAALAAVGVLAAGCADQVDAGEPVVGNVAEQGYVSGDGTTTIVAEAERKAAPDLTGHHPRRGAVRPGRSPRRGRRAQRVGVLVRPLPG